MGLTVDLCHACHNEPPTGVHHSRQMDRMLKAYVQKQVMQTYDWDTERFIREFGQNYIEEE